MKHLLAVLVAAVTLQLGTAPLAQAQTSTPTAATYTGPRYPGGPDSLRALVYRSTRLAASAPAGRLLVKFELQADGRPHRFSLVTPPAPLNKPLLEAGALALPYLEANMAAWQPGAPTPDEPSPKISLVLDFTTPLGAQPYNYCDQSPVFGTLADRVPERNRPFFERMMADFTKKNVSSSARALSTFVQMNVKYPPEALRTRQEGQVYTYFEGAENGAIERPEVVGSAGRALDNEVLQALKQLPTATSPALLGGRPARMYYVLPATFKVR